MKHDQFTLPFLDTTSLGGGLGLYSGFPTARPTTSRGGQAEETGRDRAPRRDRRLAIEARTTYFDELELKLARACRSDPIACEKDVTPLGFVSRLESALSRFEVELAEERRTVAEVSGWLPGFKARLGDAFPHQAEPGEKRAEMAELEASLAATPGGAAPAEAPEAAA
jgi:hypothetical protein